MCAPNLHAAFRWPRAACPVAVRPAAIVLALCLAQGSAFSTGPEAESGGIVAVYSSASPAYVRAREPDGSFKPETYAFGEGGLFGGASQDDTIDRLHFLDVAHAIAPALAARNYLPCDRSDSGHTELLIMVYWGTTIGTDRTSAGSQYQIAQGLVPPPRPTMSPAPNGQGGTAMVSDPSTSGRGSEAESLKATQAANDSALQESLTITSIANRQRDRQDAENAAILGYLPELKRVASYGSIGLDRGRQDVIDEIEDSRYYVVLLAYDFQLLRQHQERKLLWETRFSIRQRRNDFGRQLAAMTASASRYFGRDSHGLTHVPLPEGRVEYGQLKVLGFEPDRK